MSSPWFLLILAGILEAFWAVGLKLSEGFTRPVSSVVTILLMLASFYFLARSMRELPLGIAYPSHSAHSLPVRQRTKANKSKQVSVKSSPI